MSVNESRYRVVCQDGFIRQIDTHLLAEAWKQVEVSDKAGCRPHHLQERIDGSWYPVEKGST